MISKSIIVLKDAESNNEPLADVRWVHMILAADKWISFAIVKFSTANTKPPSIPNDPVSL